MALCNLKGWNSEIDKSLDSIIRTDANLEKNNKWNWKNNGESALQLINEVHVNVLFSYQSSITAMMMMLKANEESRYLFLRFVLLPFDLSTISALYWEHWGTALIRVKQQRSSTSSNYMQWPPEGS